MAIYKKVIKLEKYNSNPFTANLIQEITLGKKTKGYIASTPTEITNQKTGEIEDGEIAFGLKQIVDNDKFLKLYSLGINMIFNLNKSGLEVVKSILLYYQDVAIRQRADYLYINLRTLQKYGYKRKDTTFKNGINNLINNNILAPSLDKNLYWINPQAFFNGKRMTIIHQFARDNNMTAKVSKNKVNLIDNETQNPIRLSHLQQLAWDEKENKNPLDK